MKFVIERATLLKSLAHVQSVVERRTTIPILGNVKLTTKDGGVSLNATDMDLDIAETVPADVAVEGSTTAPAHTFYEIVRKLPDGAQVELAADPDAGELVLSAGRSRFTLSTLPAGDFPVMTGGEMPVHFELAGGELRTLIDRTRFAISTEETRYYLNGIFLHTTTPDTTAVLRAVATDGHRLAQVEVPAPEGAEGLEGVIIPRKTVNELRKLIDELDEPVTVDLSETKVRFAFQDAVLTSKLIDGTFPEYQRVIPDNNDKALKVDRKALASAVDRVSAISSDKSRAIKLAMEPGSLTLSASSPEQGSASESLEAEFEGQGLEIGFNTKYLLEILQQVDGDNARFDLADAGAPTIVRDAADMGALYVLMPMRV